MHAGQDQLTTQARIEQLRLDLAQAQQVRRNLIEYDKLAKDINRVPSRDTSNECARVHLTARLITAEPSHG